ncbi:MAG: hypothetical protein N2578_10275, partial [Bdellovibrionaceae bacterium]|nr:hypothetical protein [Pseudobdellovibrionaceae bacterium]
QLITLPFYGMRLTNWVRDSEKVAEMLRERLPREIRQVILITHEESLEVGGGYLYRFYRNKESGEATKVEMLSQPRFSIDYPKISSSSSE